MSGGCSVHPTPEWIVENEIKTLGPPICNKCMFDDQLKVFFVGGPNQRKDFHLEEGEELFYQVEGDMVLKVVEKGKPKDIGIKEGEVFLLPARIEHSPQRFENTVGCVIERTRKDDEMDCLRYFVEDSEARTVLWDRWFHLTDVVKDLPPIIQAFHQSEQFKTGKPSAEPKPKDPFQPVELDLANPIPLGAFIDAHLGEIDSGSPFKLYSPPAYKSEVLLYGKGTHKLSSGDGDLIVMTQRGEVELRMSSSEAYTLKPFHMARVKPGNNFELVVANGSVCLGAQIR